MERAFRTLALGAGAGALAGFYFLWRIYKENQKKLAGEKVRMSQSELIKMWSKKQGEHAWLEDVEGEKALEWVKQENAATFEALGEPKDKVRPGALC